MSGFYEIIRKELISIVSPLHKFSTSVSLKCIQFNEQELELIISGTPDIDVDEWQAATEYNEYASSDPVIVWWWQALKSFNREERAKVLSFATGTTRVPLGGFVDLQGVQGDRGFPFTVLMVIHLDWRRRIFVCTNLVLVFRLYNQGYPLNSPFAYRL